jgi:flagellar M-ring protein FliF
VVDQPGKLKRLSLAVVVDGIYKGKSHAFNPRPAEEMRQFANLAKKAVGFSADRGDQLEISCAALAPQTTEGSVAVSGSSGWQESLGSSLKIGLVVLAVLMALMLLMKRKRSTLQPPLLEGPPGSALPPPFPQEAALPVREPAPAAIPSPGPRLALPDAVDGQDKVGRLVSAYPDRAVDVLRLWLHDHDPART